MRLSYPRFLQKDELVPARRKPDRTLQREAKFVSRLPPQRPAKCCSVVGDDVLGHPPEATQRAKNYVILQMVGVVHIATASSFRRHRKCEERPFRFQGFSTTASASIQPNVPETGQC